MAIGMEINWDNLFEENTERGGTAVTSKSLVN